MAKAKTKFPEQTKINQLRALRLAAESESRAGGTWGEMGVSEIAHGPTGTMFVQLWRRDALTPERLAVFRPTLVTPADHVLYVAWYRQYRETEFSQTVVARNLNEEGARTAAAALQAKHRAQGRKVVNAAA